LTKESAHFGFDIFDVDFAYLSVI